MTTTLHLTNTNYTRGWTGDVVPHANRAMQQGSTYSIAFTFSGDRRGSTWSSVINDKWKDVDDGNVLATASITTSYSSGANKTTVTVVFSGTVLNALKSTALLKTGQTVKIGVNVNVWELREVVSSLPYIWFTGYVELLPRAGVS